MRGPWKRSPSFSLVFPHTKPLEVEFLAVKLTRFFLWHQEEVFTAKSPNISFQWQLTIFHSYPSVGFSFVLNIAEGATSINLLSNPVPTKNGFVFSPTIMNGIPPVFWSYSSNYYICIFLKRKKKAFDASISSQAVSWIYKCSTHILLLFILITQKTFKIFEFVLFIVVNLKGRLKTLSKVSSSSSVFVTFNAVSQANTEAV